MIWETCVDGMRDILCINFMSLILLPFTHSHDLLQYTMSLLPLPSLKQTPSMYSNIVSIMTSSLSAHTLVILSQRQWHGQRVGMAVIRGVGSAWIEAASWSWYKGGDERRGSPFPCQTLCPLMTSHGAPLLLHHVSQAERPNKQTQWYRLTNKQDKTGRLTSTVK